MGNFNDQDLVKEVTVEPVIGTSANDVQGIRGEEFSSLGQPAALPPFNSWGLSTSKICTIPMSKDYFERS